jgi:hypothetical protein
LAQRRPFAFVVSSDFFHPIDLRILDRYRDAAVTSLIPALSAAHVGRTHPSPSSFGYRKGASPTKCGKNIVVACWANNRQFGEIRRVSII